jgi:hypothetical protein
MVPSGLLRRVPSSPIFVTLMKEVPGSSETSVLTRATRRNNPEGTILHIYLLLNCKVDCKFEKQNKKKILEMFHSFVRYNAVRTSVVRTMLALVIMYSDRS